MVGRFEWQVRRMLRQVWVRAVAYGVLGIVTALAGLLANRVLPVDLGARIGAEAVDQILGILASSMLAVTTFSLSVMVSAFAAAAGSVTPRATALLKQDGTTQQVLATFIGSFLFALVGIVALKTGAYGEQGRVVLFVVTLVVLAAVVLALMRWVAHLMHFGRLGDTLDMVEGAAARALEARLQMPFLGGHPLRAPPPAGAVPVLSDVTGYVQHVDMAALQALAEHQGCDLFLAAIPGSFVHPAAPLLYGEGLDKADHARVRAAFAVGNGRTYDQDPRFGLIVLAEAASRALSPAVNDPGTAIDVIGRLVRVLVLWQDKAEADLSWPRLHVPPVRIEDMMDDAFRPIARDGAALAEVMLRLSKALLALAQTEPALFARIAAQHAEEVCTRAAAAGLLPRETAALEALRQELADLAHALPVPPGV